MSNDKYCDCYSMWVTDCACAQQVVEDKSGNGHTLKPKRITQCLCRKEPLTQLCGTGSCHWAGAEDQMDKPYLGIPKGLDLDSLDISAVWQDAIDALSNPRGGYYKTENLTEEPYVGVTKGFKEEIEDWRQKGNERVLASINKREKDQIYNPEHYNHGYIECIDYIEGGLSTEAFEGYLEGNIKKYLHRWRFKGKDKDLQKARWYLNKLIAFREEGA